MINSEINAVKERLCEALAPTRIYLFGSYATDTYTEDAGDRIALAQKAYRSLRGVRQRPVDIVVGYESRFDERARENTLEKVVAQEGVLLYGA